MKKQPKSFTTPEGSRRSSRRLTSQGLGDGHPQLRHDSRGLRGVEVNDSRLPPASVKDAAVVLAAYPQSNLSLQRTGLHLSTTDRMRPRYRAELRVLLGHRLSLLLHVVVRSLRSQPIAQLVASEIATARES